MNPIVAGLLGMLNNAGVYSIDPITLRVYGSVTSVSTADASDHLKYSIPHTASDARILGNVLFSPLGSVHP